MAIKERKHLCYFSGMNLQLVRFVKYRIKISILTKL